MTGRVFLKVPFLFLIVLLLLSSGCVTEPRKPRTISTGDYSYADTFLDWIITRKLIQGGIPGCAVAVVTKDDVLFQKTYGVMKTGANTPVTTDTLFRAGSITKTLTALAVMKLAEQSKIDIDRPYTAYIRDFSIKSRFPETRPITPRMLLSHRSGLFSDYLDGVMGENRLTPAELLAALRTQYLCFPPGEVFLYSNTGYALLGILITRVTGMAYEDYVRQEILDPVGMTGSALTFTPAVEPRLAAGHMPEALALLGGGSSSPVPVPFLEIRDKPAGALLSTIDDLALYVRFLLSDKDRMVPRVISNQTFLEMQTIQFQGKKESVFLVTDYGLGLMRNVIRYEGMDDVTGHSGDVNGFLSLLAYSPSLGIGMVILTNSASAYFPIYEVVSRSLRLYGEAKTGRSIGSVPNYTEKPGSISRDRLARFQGRYAFLGFSLDIILRDDGLHLVQPELEKELTLIPVGENRFKPVFKFLNLFPVEIAGYAGLTRVFISFGEEEEHPRSLTVEAWPGEAMLRLVLRREEVATTARDLTGWPGRYRIGQNNRCGEALDLYFPTREFKIVEKDGGLVLETDGLKNTIGLYFTPVTENQAVLAGSHETLFLDDDGISFLGLKAGRQNKK